MDLNKHDELPDEENEVADNEDDKDIDLDNNHSEELPGPEDVDLNRAE